MSAPDRIDDVSGDTVTFGFYDDVQEFGGACRYCHHGPYIPPLSTGETWRSTDRQQAFDLINILLEFI